MNREKAFKISEEVRPDHEISSTAKISSDKRCWIELCEGNPGEVSPVYDHLVWMVRFQDGISWKDLAISDTTGTVKNVSRAHGRTVYGAKDVINFDGSPKVLKALRVP